MYDCAYGKKFVAPSTAAGEDACAWMWKSVGGAPHVKYGTCVCGNACGQRSHAFRTQHNLLCGDRG